MPRHHGRSPGQIAARNHHEVWQTRYQTCPGYRRPRRHFRLSAGQDDNRRRRCEPRHSVERVEAAQVILVDTHVVVWVAGDPQKLSSKARAAIDQELRAGQALAISCMTLFELAHLLARGRFRTTLLIDAYLMEIESRFVVLPLVTPDAQIQQAKAVKTIC